MAQKGTKLPKYVTKAIDRVLDEKRPFFPKRFILNMNDVMAVRNNGKTIRVIEPQAYNETTVLSSEHFMFSNASKPTGFFYAMHVGPFKKYVKRKCINMQDQGPWRTVCRNENYNPRVLAAVSGSGGDYWVKDTPAFRKWCKQKG